MNRHSNNFEVPAQVNRLGLYANYRNDSLPIEGVGVLYTDISPSKCNGRGNFEGRFNSCP